MNVKTVFCPHCKKRATHQGVFGNMSFFLDLGLSTVFVGTYSCKHCALNFGVFKHEGKDGKKA